MLYCIVLYLVCVMLCCDVLYYVVMCCVLCCDMLSYIGLCCTRINCVWKLYIVAVLLLQPPVALMSSPLTLLNLPTDRLSSPSVATRENNLL